MTSTKVYINGIGCVSPQKSTDPGHFLDEPVYVEGNQLKCLDPGFREFIPADLIRRMGRIIKIGVSSARLCLRDAAAIAGEAEPLLPEAIITGTGLGCIEDTEKFLTSMIRNNDEFLTPTSFIQSTHNTVAGQIALLLKCHGYNFTYVHRGISFESALLDSIIQLETGQVASVLAGGTDELTADSFAIMERMGFWRAQTVHSADLLRTPGRGTIAGEGGAFFYLDSRKQDATYACLTGVEAFSKPQAAGEAAERAERFLAAHGLQTDDIGLLILGLNGDQTGDTAYQPLSDGPFAKTPKAAFKHLCGEYHTASSFAVWLGAMAIRTGEVPDAVRLDDKPVKSPDNILIYNHYRGNDHAFILLSKP